MIKTWMTLAAVMGVKVGFWSLALLVVVPAAAFAVRAWVRRAVREEISARIRRD